jgi:hypothetical protein
VSEAPSGDARRLVPRLPLLGVKEARFVFASTLVAAHLGEGLEPALRGHAGDRLVRLAASAAGWVSSFATLLVFFGLGFFVLRSVFVARASWSRSVLTGVTAAAAAFAITAMVAGHAGPPSRVLLASVAGAILATRALVDATPLRLVPALLVLAQLGAHVLAGRAFEQGGVVYWVAARGVSTAAWAGLVVLVVVVAQRLARASRPLTIASFALSAALAAVVAHGASAPDGSLAAFLHGALTRHGGLVPPFGLGAVPYLLPTVARILAWASIVALPVEALSLALFAALLPSLPAPLAALAVLLACHLDAAGADDDARAPA